MRKAVIAVAAGALALLGVAPPLAQADGPTASIEVLKKASATSATPGDEVTYTITVSNCKSTSSGCADVSVVDALPAGMTWKGWAGKAPAPGLVTVDLPSSSNNNTLALNFTDTIAPGNVQVFSYVVTIDDSVAPGSSLDNTVTLTGSNIKGSPLSSAVSLPITDNPTGAAGLTKTWAPSSGLAGSTDSSVITMQATNRGNRSATSLTVTDPSSGSTNPFEYLTVTELGVTLPQGATEASVTLYPASTFGSEPIALSTVCTPPGSSAAGLCLDPTSLPAGAALEDITGLEVTFAGTIAPLKSGTVSLAVDQRANSRTGNTAVPLDGMSLTNAAHATAAYAASDQVTCRSACGADADAIYQMTSAVPTINVTKNGYTPASINRNATDTVSNTITATNKSAGGITAMTISDNGEAAKNPLRAGLLTLESLAWTAPEGAATGTITFSYASGGPVTVTLPAADLASGSTAGWDWVAKTGRPAGGVTGYSFEFTAAAGGELATDNQGTVTMTTHVNWAGVDADTTSIPANYAMGKLTSRVDGAQTTGTAEAHSAPLRIVDPTYAATTTKSSRDDRVFDTGSTRVQYTVAGKVSDAAVDRLVLQDPSPDLDPTDLAGNPFNELALQQIVGVTVPQGSTLTVQYYDKDSITWVTDDTVGTLTATGGDSGTYSNIDFSPRATSAGIGIRFVLDAVAPGTLATGTTLQVTFDTTLRTDKLNEDPIVRDQITNDAGLTYTQRKDLPSNCAQTTLTLKDKEVAASDMNAEPATCPVVKFYAVAEGYGITTDLYNYWPDIPEQVDRSVKVASAQPQSETDPYAFTHIEADFTNPQGTTEVTITSYSADWAKAFDLVSVGGPIYTPLKTSAQKNPGLKLIEGEQAIITWLDEDGKQLGSNIVAGSGATRSSGGEFSQAAPATSTNSLGVARRVAGYTVTFSRSDGHALSDDFFTQFPGLGTSFPKILAGQVHALRATAENMAASWPDAVRVTGTPSAPAGYILAEGRYLGAVQGDKDAGKYYADLYARCIAANGDGGGDTSGYPHTSTRVTQDAGTYIGATGKGTDTLASTCGSVPLRVSGSATRGGDDPTTATATSWQTRVPIAQVGANAYNYARIVDVDVNVSMETKLQRVTGAAARTVDDNPILVPVAGSAPVAGYPKAILSGTAKLDSKTTVDQFVATIGATSVPDPTQVTNPRNFDTALPGVDASATLFDYFVPTGLGTLTLTGQGQLSATIYTRTGGTVAAVTTITGTADQITKGVTAALADPTTRNDFAGLAVTATPTPGASGIATGASIQFQLDLQLRETVWNTTTPIQQALTDGTLVVGQDGSTRVTASAMDPVMNRHAPTTPSITLLQGNRAIGLAAQFVADSGPLDTHPATQLRIQASNNGVTDEPSMTIDARSWASETDTSSALWNSFDLTGPPVITPPLLSGASQAATAVVTLYDDDGTELAVVTLTCAQGECTGTWDTVDFAQVRGLTVMFSPPAGGVIAATQLSSDAATVVLPLRLRTTFLHPADANGQPRAGGAFTTPQYGTAVPATIAAWESTGTDVVRAPDATPTFTPTLGHPKIAISKYAGNGTDQANYGTGVKTLWPGAKASYAIEVENTGTQSMSPLLVSDDVPVGLTWEPGSTTSWVWDGSAWVELEGVTPSTDATTGVMTWDFGSFVLTPGARVRVLTTFAVGAVKSADLTNGAHVEVMDRNPDRLPAGEYCDQATVSPARTLTPGIVTGCDAAHTDDLMYVGGYRIQTLSRGTEYPTGYEYVREDPSTGTVTSGNGGVCAPTTGLDENYTAYPCAAVSDVNDVVSYRIRIDNYNQADSGSLQVADLLPALGDHLFTDDDPMFARGTEFPGHTLRSVPMVNQYDVNGILLASSDPAIDNPLIVRLEPVFSYCPYDQSCSDLSAAGWVPLPASVSPTSPLQVSGLRMDLAFPGEHPFVLGDSVRVDFDVATPSIQDAALLGDTADFAALLGRGTRDSLLSSWNTGAFAAFNLAGEQLTNGLEESAKAGAVLRLAALDVRASLLNRTRVDDSALGDWTVRVTDQETGAVWTFPYSARATTGALTIASDNPAGDFWSLTPQQVMFAVPGHTYQLDVTTAAGARLVERAFTASADAAWTPSDIRAASLGVTLEYVPGSLTISKTVDGAAQPDPGIDYPFEASCLFGGTEILTAAETSFELAGGESLTLDRLPMGTQCTVWETASGVGAATVPAALTSPDGWVTTIKATAPDQRLDVVNSYSPRTLVVTKAVERPVGFPTDELGTFVIDVACTSAQTPGASFTTQLTLTEGATRSYPDLPADAQCTVAESAHGHAATWAATGSAGVDVDAGVASIDFTASGPQARQVMVTNTFTTQTLSLTKQVTGPAPASGAWDFAVRCLWNGVWLNDSATGVTAGQTVTWTMPTDSVCALTETDPRGASSTTWAGSGVTDPGSAPAGVRLVAPAAVTVTNHFDEPVAPAPSTTPTPTTSASPTATSTPTETARPTATPTATGTPSPSTFPSASATPGPTGSATLPATATPSASTGGIVLPDTGESSSPSAEPGTLPFTGAHAAAQLQLTVVFLVGGALLIFTARRRLRAFIVPAGGRASHRKE